MIPLCTSLIISSVCSRRNRRSKPIGTRRHGPGDLMAPGTICIHTLASPTRQLSRSNRTPTRDITGCLAACNTSQLHAPCVQCSQVDLCGNGLSAVAFARGVNVCQADDNCARWKRRGVWWQWVLWSPTHAHTYTRTNTYTYSEGWRDTNTHYRTCFVHKHVEHTYT